MKLTKCRRLICYVAAVGSVSWPLVAPRYAWESPLPCQQPGGQGENGAGSPHEVDSAGRMHWLKGIANSVVPLPDKKSMAASETAARTYYATWRRNDLANVIASYAASSRMLQYRGKYKGKVVEGRDAALLMLETWTKHIQAMQARPEPKLAALRVTYGQAVALLSLELNADSLKRLEAGKYIQPGSLVYFKVSLDGKDYLYGSVKESGVWKALNQPYSLELPAELAKQQN